MYALGSASHSHCDVPHDEQIRRDSNSHATAFARSSAGHARNCECGMPCDVHHSTSRANAASYLSRSV